MRHISFMLTAPQIEDESKDVTRRLRNNWKPGEQRLAIFKGQGILKGQHVRYLRYPHNGSQIIVECLSVRYEPLWKLLLDPDYGRQEVIREGFPQMTPLEFVEFFCKHAKCDRNQIVYRYHFKHVKPYEPSPTQT